MEEINKAIQMSMQLEEQRNREINDEDEMLKQAIALSKQES